jgi:hypothetical protein
LCIPATAQAATLTVPRPCPEESTTITITGSGFAPNSAVLINGGDTPITVATGPDGSFSLPYRTPFQGSFTPRTLTLSATDRTDPTLTANVTFQVVSFGSNAPVDGNPTQVTTWQFAGFPGRTIYGHFRFRGKTIVNYRFGKAQGACGTLVKRARRLPARVRKGTWTLQIDASPYFNPKTRPAFAGSFTVLK